MTIYNLFYKRKLPEAYLQPNGPTELSIHMPFLSLTESHLGLGMAKQIGSVSFAVIYLTEKPEVYDPKKHEPSTVYRKEAEACPTK